MPWVVGSFPPPPPLAIQSVMWTPFQMDLHLLTSAATVSPTYTDRVSHSSCPSNSSRYPSCCIHPTSKEVTWFLLLGVVFGGARIPWGERHDWRWLGVSRGFTRDSWWSPPVRFWASLLALNQRVLVESRVFREFPPLLCQLLFIESKFWLRYSRPTALVSIISWQKCSLRGNQTCQ